MNLLEKYINLEVYKKVEKSVFFFKNGKEIIVFTKSSLKFLSSEKNLKVWINKNFSGLFLNFSETDLSDNQVKDITKKLYDEMIVDLQIKNQYSVLSYKRNPWAEEPKIIRDDHKLEYIAPSFYMKPFYETFSIKKVDMNEVVNDYREHFPQFDEFLDWLIANRFTSNRRTSYTYLRVSAGFGKSFLASLFEDLGVGRKIEQRQLKHSSANDLSPSDFRNSFILIIDEFTHFSQELKDITHGMYLSAKYQLTEYVSLYAKVFLSAEKSTSFFGDAGVDEQLADRVSIMDLSNMGKLEDRELYRKNTKFYHEALKKYINLFFRDKVDYYVKLGELEANKKANLILQKYFQKYRIKSNTIEKIREKCVVYLRDFVEWKNDIYLDKDGFNYKPRNSFFEKLEGIVFVKNEDEIVTKDIVKMYEILISEGGEHFQKIAKFKQTMLDEVFRTNLIKKQYKCEVAKLQKKNIRGVLINLVKLEQKIPLIIEDCDGNKIDEKLFKIQ